MDYIGTNYPLVYRVFCKRGFFWEEKNLELHNDYVQYVHIKTNEVRFKALLDECIVTEKSSKNKYRIKIESKKKNFKKVSIKANNNEVLKRFKKEFEMTLKAKKEKFNKETIKKKDSINEENIIKDIKQNELDNLNESRYIKKIPIKITCNNIQENPIFKDKLDLYKYKRFRFLATIGNILCQTDNDDFNFNIEMFNKENLREINNNYFQRLSNSFSIIKQEEFDLKKIIVLNLLLSLFLLYNIWILYCFLLVIIGKIVIFNKNIHTKIDSSLESIQALFREPTSKGSFKDCFLKFSVSTDHDINKILYYLCSPSTYTDWNCNLKDSYTDEDGKLHYIFFNSEKRYLIENSSRDLFEIRGLSRKIFNVNPNRYAIFDFKSEEHIYKLINLEYDSIFNKCLIEMVIKFDEKYPCFHNKSITNSLNLLISFLNEVEMNEDFTCEYYIDQSEKKEKYVELDDISAFSIKTDIKAKDKTELEKEPKDNQINNMTNVLPFFTTDDKEINLENERCYTLIKTKLEDYKIFIHRDWILWEEKRDKDFKLFYIDEKSSLRAIKSETIINKPIKTVYEFIHNFKNKQVYDKNFESGYEIRNINQNIVLTYQKYRGKLGFEPRDYYVLLHKTYDGSEPLILGTSFFADKYKEENKTVRAQLHYGGFNFKRIEEEKTLLTFFYLSDLKISNFFVKRALPDIGQCVLHIKEQLMKN